MSTASRYAPHKYDPLNLAQTSTSARGLLSEKAAGSPKDAPAAAPAAKEETKTEAKKTDAALPATPAVNATPAQTPDQAANKKAWCVDQLTPNFFAAPSK